MCTNFERSGYEVLKLFDTDKPKSAHEVYTQLHNSRTRILLGARVTIDDFVESLYRGNELARMGTVGYVLTKHGKQELSRLRDIVERADHAISC